MSISSRKRDGRPPEAGGRAGSSPPPSPSPPLSPAGGASSSWAPSLCCAGTSRVVSSLCAKVSLRSTSAIFFSGAYRSGRLLSGPVAVCDKDLLDLVHVVQVTGVAGTALRRRGVTARVMEILVHYQLRGPAQADEHLLGVAGLAGPD